MFTKVEGLPAGVIGVEASGEVGGDDYRDVLVPMIEEALAGGSKVRLLYVIDEDADITAGGAWADAKLGVKHFTAFDRIAVVTDIDWIENSVKALGWAIPGEVKTFDDDDRDEAVEWLTH